MATSDRQYLAQLAAGGLWTPRKPLGKYSDATVRRYAGAFRRQEAAGVPLSAGVARGHGVTPEHPGRGLRNVSETYQGSIRPTRGSKYARTPKGQAAGKRFTMHGVSHFRPQTEPDISTPEGEMFTRQEAVEILREIVPAARRGDRVTINIFDCSLQPHGRWRQLFLNPGHGMGINAAYLLAMWQQSGQPFEQFLIGLANRQGGSGGAGAADAFKHICLYELYILPRETAAVRQLRQRKAQVQGASASERGRLRQAALWG